MARKSTPSVSDRAVSSEASWFPSSPRTWSRPCFKLVAVPFLTPSKVTMSMSSMGETQCHPYAIQWTPFNSMEIPPPPTLKFMQWGRWEIPTESPNWCAAYYPKWIVLLWLAWELLNRDCRVQTISACWIWPNCCTKSSCKKWNAPIPTKRFASLIRTMCPSIAFYLVIVPLLFGNIWKGRSIHTLDPVRTWNLSPSHFIKKGDSFLWGNVTFYLAIVENYTANHKLDPVRTLNHPLDITSRRWTDLGVWVRYVHRMGHPTIVSFSNCAPFVAGCAFPSSKWMVSDQPPTRTNQQIMMMSRFVLGSSRVFIFLLWFLVFHFYLGRANLWIQ